MTYDHLEALTMARDVWWRKEPTNETITITPEQWNDVKCDPRILAHVDYNKQERSFVMNGVTIRVDTSKPTV